MTNNRLAVVDLLSHTNHVWIQEFLSGVLQKILNQKQSPWRIRFYRCSKDASFVRNPHWRLSSGLWTFSTQPKPETHFAVPQVPDKEGRRKATHLSRRSLYLGYKTSLVSTISDCRACIYTSKGPYRDIRTRKQATLSYIVE